MSKEGGSGGAGSQDAGGAPGDPAKDALFEARGPKKIVRIITVLAYMFSVSFVAIVLSAYYLFLWEPPNPRLLHGASRFREGPRVHYLRADPPQVKTHIHENLEDDSFNDNFDHDEAGHKLGSYNKDYDNFYETLVSLRSTLNDVLRERSNDSAIDQNLTERVGNHFSPSDRVAIDGERSQTLTDDSANVRKDIPQEAKFIPGDKSGINDNITRTLPHRRKEKDGSEHPTTTVRQVSEYIVKRHQFLWNTTNKGLIRSDDRSNYYNDSRNTNGGGREDGKKDTKTTETQIEEVTARSTMINDTLERSETSTTLIEKSLIEMLTETTKPKGVSPYMLSSAAPTKVEMGDVVKITKSYEESPSRN